MIHVDRQRVAEPDDLGPDGRGPLETAEAIEFYSRPPAERRQERFPWKTYRSRHVRDALLEMFHGKCAYCESKIATTQPGDVGQFRPKAGVKSDTGEHLPDHYYWLANEWTNLYVTCVDCNRTRRQEIGDVEVASGKGNRFPLEDESMRAPMLASLEELEQERPLLLDPCRDDPEQHLVFSEDGHVLSETPQGQASIDILGLNRRPLVEARRETAVYVMSELKRLEEDSRAESKQARGQLERVIGMQQDDQEYAALKRQLIGPVLDRLRSLTPGAGPPEEQPQRRTKGDIDRIGREFQAYQTSQEDFSLDELDDEEQRRKYFSRSRVVERIEIVNIKAIRELKIDLRASGAGTPWTMFLGENGTGKSTVLHALALALVGERYFTELIDRFELNPADFIRAGCKRGQVKVFLGPEPHTLTFHADRFEYTGPGKGHVIFKNGDIKRKGEKWSIQMLLLGYGATRLLPRTPERGRAAGQVSNFARVENLFDPFFPLVDARTWLLDLPDESFDYVALALKALLDLEEKSRLVREDDDVWLRSYRKRVPLDLLSDGYQSVVAMTSDILQVVLGGLWERPDMAEGLVLLDEVGAHMHPAWKKRIVSEIRAFLPGIQFIATTHEPLCLRGLVNGEVVVMQRLTNGRVIPVTELPQIEGLRTDQILTSEYFGLDSTSDPKYQRIYDEYYDLLRRKQRDPEDAQRLAELVVELDELREMGSTRRERIMLHAIDEYLAREVSIPDQSLRSAEKNKLDRRLEAILTELEEA